MSAHVGKTAAGIRAVDDPVARQANALLRGRAQPPGHRPVRPYYLVVLVKDGDQVGHAVERPLPLLLGPTKVSSSACFRSVMSTPVPAKRIGLPVASRTATPRTSTVRMEPSLWLKWRTSLSYSAVSPARYAQGRFPHRIAVVRVNQLFYWVDPCSWAGIIAEVLPAIDVARLAVAEVAVRHLDVPN